MSGSTALGLWLQMGVDEYRDLGFAFGQFLHVLVPLAFITWRGLVAFRARANAKAVLSLPLLLVPWLVVGSTGFARAEPALMAVLTLLSVLLAWPTAFVFAILGFGEMRRERDNYDRGKGSAITTLVLLGSATCLFGYFAIDRMIAMSESVEQGDFRPATVSAKIIENEEFNFRFKMPAKPWATLDTAAVHPDASVALFNPRAKKGFFLIAESTSPGTLSLEALVSVAKANAESTSQSVEVAWERSESIGDLEGIRMRLLTKNVGSEGAKTVDSFNAARNGYIYQLLLVSRSGTDKTGAEADALFANFSQLDPDRTVPSGEPAVPYKSERLGYTVDVGDGATWGKWDSFETDYPQFEYASMSHDQQSAIVTTGVNLAGRKTNTTAVASSLLGLLDFELEDLDAVPAKDHAGARVLELTGRRKLEGDEYIYAFRIFHGEERGLLVAVWTFDSGTVGFEELRADLDLATFGATAALDREMTERELEIQSTVWSGLAQAHAQAREWKEAADWAAAASDLKPNDSDQAHAAYRALVDARRYEEALERARAFVDRHPADLGVKSWIPYLLSMLDQDDEARELWRELFESGHRDDVDLRLFVESLHEAELASEGLAALDSYATDADASHLARSRAELLSQLERHDEAIAILEGLRKKDSLNLGLSWALIDALSKADRHGDELAVAEALLAEGHTSTDVWYFKGRAEYELERYDAATKSLQAALAITPGDRSSERLLRSVAAAAGKGDSSAVRNPLKAVALPTELLENLPPAPENLDGRGAWFDYWTLATSYLEGKELRTTKRYRLVIADRNGADEFGTLTEDFDPQAERLFVNRLEVFSAEGELLATADPTDSYILDKPSYMASTDQVLHIPVPSLRPGVTLEFEITRVDHGTPEHLRYIQSYLTGRFPARRRAFALSGDLDHAKVSVSGGVREQPVAFGRSWYVDSPTTARQEARQAHPDTFAPMVRVSDSRSDWNALAVDYSEDLADYLEVQEEISELARTLTRDSTDLIDKVDALARRVQQGCNYTAIEFGPRARIPKQAVATVREGHGDCKDHSVLLQQLLQAAGIPSHLALTLASGEVNDEHPSLDQFDHMIVHVPALGADRFIDCTAKHLAPLATTPLGLGGQLALVLDGENSRLMKIPELVPSGSTLNIQREIRPTEAGNGEMESRVELDGHLAAHMRAYLASREPSERLSGIQGWLGSHARGFEISELSVEKLEDLSSPLILNVTSQITGWLYRGEGRLVGRLPAPWEHAYIATRAVPGRQTPFELTPLRVTSRSIVRSNRLVAEELDLDATTESEAQVGWTMTPSRMDGQFVLDAEVTLEGGHHAAGSFDTFVEVTERVLAGLERPVALRP